MAYIPINCDFYDKLEAYATLKTSLHIVYSEESIQKELQDVMIINLYAKNHEEFIVFDNHQTLRLDKLISVNGESIPSSC